MKKLKYFPFMLLPILYGLYQLTNLDEIKSIDDAIEKSIELLWIVAVVIITALVQIGLIELWHRKQIDGYISYLDYLGRTNKHIAAMKTKTYMEHAKDWKFKQFDAPDYTN